MQPNQLSLAFITALLLTLVAVQSSECLVQNCQICLSPNSCAQCVDTFYVQKNGLCQACNDNYCRVCPNNQCQECRAGFYLGNLDQRCKSCQDLHCLSCTSNGNCSRCFQGYFLQKATNYMICRACGYGCKTCQTINTCLGCQDGYFLMNLNNANVCQSCELNLCKTCDSLGNCLSCFNGSYLSTDDQGASRCFSCIDPNCEICQNRAGMCLTCSTGYYHSKEGKIQCLSCQKYGCSACTGPSNCSACAEGYVLNQTKCLACTTENCKFCGYGVCTECMRGYFLKPVNQALTCASCSSINCRSCYNNGSCYQCLSKYYLVKGGCMQCKDPLCDICPGNICVTCLEGYGIFTNKTVCQPCLQSNCAVCDNVGKCLICKNGMYLIDGQCQTCSVSNCQKCQPNNNRACSLCQAGYFLKEQRCHPCADNNCSKCASSTGLCLECLDNFYLNGSRCVKCQLQRCALCVIHEQHLKCQACIEGYFWSKQSQKCIVNLYQVRAPPLWMMISGLLVIIFILLLAYRFMLKRHLDQARAEQQQNQQPYMQFQEIN